MGAARAPTPSLLCFTRAGMGAYVLGVKAETTCACLPCVRRPLLLTVLALLLSSGLTQVLGEVSSCPLVLVACPLRAACIAVALYFVCFNFDTAVSEIAIQVPRKILKLD